MSWHYLTTTFSWPLLAIAKMLKSYFIIMQVQYDQWPNEETEITRGATYKSILKVLLKQNRSPTDPNKFKSATIISVDHFQITMRHDLDRWPFDPKINRAHPWLMGSKCMKFHDHRLITESVIVRKPFSNNHAPWPWPLTFWPQNQ